MKKITLIIFVLAVSFTAKSQHIPKWKIKDVANYYSKKSDSVYVINFWATFCMPCMAEIPYLQAITKKYGAQKATLLLVSLDLPSYYPAKIETLAKKNNLTADIVWLDESDADHFCPVVDKSWSGSMPATLFVNALTGYKKFVESAMSKQEFETELKTAIAGKKLE